MPRRILTVTAVVAALAASVLSGCSRADTPATKPEPLRLGALVPLSGRDAPIGTTMVTAYEMAVKEANDAGGVLGHRVELVTGDDACEPGTAVTKANELVARNVTVSVGGLCSAATVPTLKVFRAVGVPMIIPGANSSDLLAPRYDSIFLLAGTTAIEAQRAIAWMRPLGSHRLALVGDGTSFSDTIVAGALTSVQQPGSGITVAAELKLSQGASGYPRIAEAVLGAKADMVFFTGYAAEAARLIRDLRAAAYTGKIMLSDGSMAPALFNEIDPAVVEGVYGLALPLAQFEPKAAAWAARYQAIAGVPPGPFTMQAYDAVRLALNAVRRAGSLDRAAVRRAIAGTTPVDVQLLSGPSTFNPDGTQVNSTFVQLNVRHGAFALAPVTQ
jgi:branched-chain amino acid transport system substrate-binding protein